MDTPNAVIMLCQIGANVTAYRGKVYMNTIISLVIFFKTILLSQVLLRNEQQL